MSPWILQLGIKFNIKQRISKNFLNIFCFYPIEGLSFIKMTFLGNLCGPLTLSAKTSENYFLIGPSADTECKLRIPHEHSAPDSPYPFGCTRSTLSLAGTSQLPKNNNSILYFCGMFSTKTKGIVVSSSEALDCTGLYCLIVSQS